MNFINKFLKKWDGMEEYSFGLTNIFDVNKMSEEEIFHFLNIEEHKKNIYYFLYELREKYKEFEDGFNEKIYDLFFDYKKYSEKIKDNKVIYRLFIKCLCAYSIIDTKINDGGGIKKITLNLNNLEKFLSKYEDPDHLYRGQSDYSWDIIPSIFRGHIFFTSHEGEIFDKDLMYYKYYNSGLIQKYNSTIAKPIISCSGDLSCEFIAYMQHSVAYSPLIDVTSKSLIGLQFALGNKAYINDYYGKDAAIYDFQDLGNNSYDDNQRNIDENNENFTIIILKKKITVGKIMKVEDINKNVKTLDCTSISKIIKILTPKYKIINSILNDRMRYQHGKFIIFYDYVLVENKIIYWLNKNLKVEKYHIDKNLKDKIYDILNEKFPQFNMDFLMNPYEYFKK